MDTLRLLAQPKEGEQFKNKKQPELTENRTVWNPDNQGVKEGTFIQTGRRGGDEQPGPRGLKASGSWRTQRGGELWDGAGSAAASRPPNPTFVYR